MAFRKLMSDIMKSNNYLYAIEIDTDGVGYSRTHTLKLYHSQSTDPDYSFTFRDLKNGQISIEYKSGENLEISTEADTLNQIVFEYTMEYIEEYKNTIEKISGSFQNISKRIDLSKIEHLSHWYVKEAESIDYNQLFHIKHLNLHRDMLPIEQIEKFAGRIARVGVFDYDNKVLNEFLKKFRDGKMNENIESMTVDFIDEFNENMIFLLDLVEGLDFYNCYSPLFFSHGHFEFKSSVNPHKSFRVHLDDSLSITVVHDSPFHTMPKRARYASSESDESDDDQSIQFNPPISWSPFCQYNDIPIVEEKDPHMEQIRLNLLEMEIDNPSPNWFDLPFEMREMIIDEMDSKTKCRFTRCSKLCEKEAKESKNYLYMIQLKRESLDVSNYCILKVYHTFIENGNHRRPTADYSFTFTDMKNGQISIGCFNSKFQTLKTETGSLEQITTNYTMKFIEKYKKSIKKIEYKDEVRQQPFLDMIDFTNLAKLEYFTSSTWLDDNTFSSCFEKSKQINHVDISDDNLSADQLIKFQGKTANFSGRGITEKGVEDYLKKCKQGMIHENVERIKIRFCKEINKREMLENMMKDLDGYDYKKTDEDDVTFNIDIQNNLFFVCLNSWTITVLKNPTAY